MTADSPREISKTQPKQRMLSPAAYSEAAMPSLRLARSSQRARFLGKSLFYLLLVAFLLVAIAPWQQSVKGTGNVIAYAPRERQQTIEAPVKGRIVELGEGIIENAPVKKNQLIARIADIDPLFLDRLKQQLQASESQVQASERVVDANKRSVEAAKAAVSSYESNIESYKQAKVQIIAGADAAMESAKNKIEAEKQQLIEHEAALLQIKNDYERQKQLFEEQIVSQLKFQETERKLKEVQAKVAKSQEYVKAAVNDLITKKSERQEKELKANVDIEKALADLQKAKADVAKTQSEMSKAAATLSKDQKSLFATQSKVSQQQSQEVRAPFDGFLMNITPNQGSKILKQGDPICTIVPDTADRAVQVWLDGNDAPLVQPGRHVRLQFEGWPAVQFAGWPSVAVGTFGGQVISVDPSDNGKGKFRILVLPDESSNQWPGQRFLRQGVRANGWVLLEQVPLWYEIWRNVNGFPPVVSTEEPKGKSKAPKLPKP